MIGGAVRFMLWGCVCALSSGVAAAHTSLGEYVQHRYSLAVSSKNIDLTVELTFNGDPAHSERAVMDTNKDGVVSGDEQRTYVAAWEKASLEQIRLLLNKTTVPIMSLYAPELDLQQDRGVGRHPFVIRLKLFARTPETLVPGAPIHLDSSLQAAAPALVALEARGDADSPITVEPGHGDTLPALKAGARGFEVRCPEFSRSGKVAAPFQTQSGLKSQAPTQPSTPSHSRLSDSSSASTNGNIRHD